MRSSSARSLAAVGLGLVAAGWWLGWAALVALGTAALVAVGAAALLLLGRPELEVARRLSPDRVTAGEEATGWIELANPRGRTSGATVATETVGDRAVEVAIPRLAPGARERTRYDLPTDRRGVITVGPLRLRRVDPLGLLRADRTYGDTDVLWVHPRRQVVPPLPSKLLRSLEGPTSDNSPQGTITFHSLREYVRGDELRHIHWRTSARTGTLMVRQLVDTSLPDVTVVLDARPAAYQDRDDLEQGVEVAASVLSACCRHRFPAHLRTTTGDEVDAGGDQDAEGRLLDHLAAMVPSDATGLSTTIERVARDGSGTAAVVVTGPAERAGLGSVPLLLRRFAVVIVVSVAAEGTTTPAVPGTEGYGVTTSADFARAWTSRATT